MVHYICFMQMVTLTQLAQNDSVSQLEWQGPSDEGKQSRTTYNAAMKNPDWFAEINTAYDTPVFTDKQLEKILSD